MLLFVVTLCF